MKIFEIDWDSEEEVKLHLQKVKARYYSLKMDHKSIREVKKEHLDAMYKILETDISSIYDGEVILDDAPKYYVYAHLNPLRKICINKSGFRAPARMIFAASLGMGSMPFYIGKGMGERAHELNRNDGHRKMRSLIRKTGDDVLVHFIKKGLSEREALMMESKLIDIFGISLRGGCLVNLDEGQAVSERRVLYEDAYKKIQNPWKKKVDTTPNDV
jgi:hypothetical protein